MEVKDLMPEEMVKEIQLEKVKDKRTAMVVKVFVTVFLFGLVIYDWLSGLTLPDSVYALCGVVFVWWLWYDIIPFTERKFDGKDMYERQAEARELMFVQMLIKYLEKHPHMKDIRLELNGLSERISRLEKSV